MTFDRIGPVGGLIVAVIVGIQAGPLQAQDVSVTPFLSAGPDRSGFSFSAGVRLDAVERWGAYARAAARGVTNTCNDAIGRACTYPTGGAGEFAVGASYSLFSTDRWTGRAGVGGGFLAWQDEWDPFVELAADVRRMLSGRLELFFGLHGLVAPGVERERRPEEKYVTRKTVTFPNAVLGLSFRLD